MAKSRTPTSATTRWRRIFRKALRDYGSKAQAARIAWGAIDSVMPARKSRPPARSRSTRKKA